MNTSACTWLQHGDMMMRCNGLLWHWSEGLTLVNWRETKMGAWIERYVAPADTIMFSSRKVNV